MDAEIRVVVADDEYRFISWLKTHEGVEFVVCNQVNEEFRAGKIKRAEVRGGV